MIQSLAPENDSSTTNTLRLILGDQLNAQHSWFQKSDDSVLYLIAELKQETGYVRHHGQKICAFFAAMEAFAKTLDQAGHRVLYLTLDQTADFADLPKLIEHLFSTYQCQTFEFQRPDEYRLLMQLRTLALGSHEPPANSQDESKGEGNETSAGEFDSEHFLLAFDDISKDFKADKHVRMESFYRRMRKRHQVLMEGDEPVGGKWNYDAENRGSFKKKDIAGIPEPLVFDNDVSAILERLKTHQVDYFGNTPEQLIWPVNVSQAQQALEHFCEVCLSRFGQFQDAMTDQSEHAWSQYHSRISFALNIKILSPADVLDTVIDYYYQHEDDISLAQIEGFVRQILGWREYVRGMYWANMPDYRKLNALAAKRDLPSWFWSGETRMNCMHQAIKQSLDYAYAHHIQRLMITGNFAMLAGIDPDQVDDWYLGIYIDAIEWVELPNTRGMSQFADGGLIATKPYAASGNYIDKMSDYCKSCHYRVKDKTGDTACPFNSLYWNFMTRHRERLEQNPRIGMIYGNWDRKSDNARQAVQKRAEWCLDNLDAL